MKQRITPEQLMELSAEQKEKLREWWFKKGPQEGDWIGAVPGPHIFTNYKYQPYANSNEWELMVGDGDRPRPYLMLLPNIGQMIELLKWPSIKPIADYHHNWVVINNINLYEAKELTDALWDAVKATL